jgi:uncharacterized membrane protein HdeD (DUF308 family)
MAAPAAPAGRVSTPWWGALIAGIAMTVIGALLFLAPGLTTIALVRILGIYWLVDGILRLVGIFVDRSGWIWKLASGVLGIIAGLAVVEHPLVSAVFVPTMLVVYIGIMSIGLGVVELIMAFRGAGWATGILGALSVVIGTLLMLNPLAGALALPLVVGTLGLIGGLATVISSITIPLLVRRSGR